MGQQLMDDACRTPVGHNLFLTIVNIQQLTVIQAEQVQQRSLIVIGGHHIFDRAMAKFVGLAKGHSARGSAAGQPHTETLAIMIPAGFLTGTMVLRHGQSPNFSAPMDQGSVEHAALFEIVHERSRRLICTATDCTQAALKVAVVVPGLATQE